MNKLTESKTCGAKLRKKDAYCRNKAILVNGRCRNHGGLTPKGIASPHYKHGRYSRHLPTHVRDRYYESLNDPELTALRDDLALIDIHISEVLMEMHSPAADVDTKLFRDKIELCRLELLESDPANKLVRDVVDVLDEVDAVIGRGARNAGDLSRLLSLLEQRRKTAESENRRVFRSNNAFTVEQAIAFVRLLGYSVKRHVTDPRQRSAVYEDFAKAVGR
ncbi:MAG: hypothetical protein JNL64_00045 [Blastocatellia bacterium]|nr:hypothetical protein [Blastocatellia bacterium]